MKTDSDGEPSKLNRAVIAVHVPQGDEVGWFDGQLAAQHYLGAGRAVGDYLRQVVRREDQPVALLVWGPACYALKDRDLWISWSASQRVERLKLIVQNRRFLVLAAKGESPNLASQAMGAALRALPAQWQERFGYRPLLAESFTDPEAYAGTCYKASNWEAVGYSAGYSRHRADFYVPNERPKRLWLRPLVPEAGRAIAGPAGARRLSRWPECAAFRNTAGQRQTNGLLAGGVSEGPRSAGQEYPLSDWAGLDADRAWRCWPDGGRLPKSPALPRP